MTLEPASIKRCHLSHPTQSGLLAAPATLLRGEVWSIRAQDNRLGPNMRNTRKETAIWRILSHWHGADLPKWLFNRSFLAGLSISLIVSASAGLPGQPVPPDVQEQDQTLLSSFPANIEGEIETQEHAEEKLAKFDTWWKTEMRPFTAQIEAYEKNVGDFDKQVESMRRNLQITPEQYNQWEKDLGRVCKSSM